MELTKETEDEQENKTERDVLQVDRRSIPSIPLSESLSESVDQGTLETLSALGVSAHSSYDIATSLHHRLELLQKEQQQTSFENEQDSLLKEIESLKQALKDESLSEEQLEEVKKKIAKAQKKLQDSRKKEEKRLDREKQKEDIEDAFDSALNSAQKERMKLISTGKMTPFEVFDSAHRKQLLSGSSSSLSERPVKDSSTYEIKGNKRREEKQQSAEEEPVQKKRRTRSSIPLSRLDDGDDSVFHNRVHVDEREEEHEGPKEEEEEEEEEDGYVEFEGGYRVQSSVYGKLFEYQRTGIKWMWELHSQSAGGIIGDEMGLGKTIQTIVFLSGLQYSEMLEGAVLLVCPATLMQQWVQEFHNWCPSFRVALLHDSGSHKGSKKDAVKKITAQNGVLITTYEGVRLNHKLLLKWNWEYVILDEGHKIRNPDAEITLVCKRFSTPHRLILSGAPIQNNLTELWSIFDFVFPGLLGTLPTFQSEFAVPITMGGYSNASTIQVQTAYKCAVGLRDLINPYLLRRLKSDVLSELPKSNEQVLFCKLTDFQRKSYEEFLKSEEVESIFQGKRNLLYGIDILRKICNHPDLLKRISQDRPEDYGNWNRSGKLKVLEKLLPLWQKQGHKVLLFAQTRQMLDILEKFVKEMQYTYCRLDGNTAIRDRMSLVDLFNNSPEVFLFLLSTKVGGLGLNLVGATRVIIFDPDWNPSTDVQARERACRIGQTQQVTIYRLITCGTLEEKIYHRQIFKQFLTNKILKDPKQRRFFKFKDLRDLFTLGAEYQKIESENVLDTDLEQHSNEAMFKQTNEKEEEDNKEDKEDKEDNAEAMDLRDTKDEAFVLRRLFDSRDGIKGVLSHDSVMAKSDSEYEMSIVESSANKIAQKALENLQKSREECAQQEVSVPTWTGRSGLSGAPFFQSSSQRFGVKNMMSATQTATKEHFNSSSSSGGFSSKSTPLSSKDLITSIQEQQSSSVSSPDKFSSLLQKIRAYLKEHNGKASSQDIVEAFRTEVPSSDLLVFRSMLRGLCTFEKSSKTWRLKEEYS